eukprot:s4606_g4.t1
MFDFDELSGEESEAKQQPQLEVQLGEAPAEAHDSEPSKPSLETCVKVSHAIHGWTIAVFLPEKALFRDLRHSLAKYFLQDSKVSSFSGQLMHKEGGVYRPYKDKDAIGSTREVLLAGFEGEPPQSGLEIHVAEEDLKDCDLSEVRPDRPASLDEFLILQKELKAGFADESFQEKLRRLQQQCERRELAKTKFLAERLFEGLGALGQLSHWFSCQTFFSLISALERLTLAVREGGLGVGGGLEDWELVEEDYKGPGFGAVLNFRLEEGPPATPSQLCELGRKLTSSKADGQERIRRAFTAGFWAKIALLCDVSLSGPEPIALKDTQFLVIRAFGLSHPVRVLKAEERDQLVGGVPKACRGAGVLLWSWHWCSCTLQMQKQRIRFGHEGDPSLLVLSLTPEQSATGESVEVFAVPLFARQGGLLLAIPDSSLSPGLLTPDESLQTGESLFGPGDTFNAPLYEDTDEGLVLIGLEAVVQVFDAADGLLQNIREYDPVTDSHEPIRPYHPTAPHTFPHGDVFLSHVREWMRALASGGTLFYSAQEDLNPPAKAPGVGPVDTKKAAAPKRVTQAALLERMDVLAGQMQMLLARQDQLEDQSRGSTAKDAFVPQGVSARALPAVSAGLANPGTLPLGMSTVQKAVTLAGPPPRHKEAKAFVASQAPVEEQGGGSRGEPGGSNWEAALVEQSAALTSLVAHLAAHSSDGISDLNLGVTSSQTSGTRGVLRREKMQSDLAARSGNFYLQLMQQMHRRLHPGKPVPQSLADLQSLSMLQYLERQGGFRQQRETGLIMWMLGHVVDAINAEDWAGVRELVALTVVALEQSAVDHGDWSLAFLLALVAEPPVQMFQDQMVSMSPHGRPFAPLCPASWAATTLSYLKDMETLSTKKGEVVTKAKSAASPAAASPSSESPSPKRKPRYPKKVKASEEAA